VSYEPIPDVRVQVHALHEGATVEVDGEKLAALVAQAISRTDRPYAKVQISICATDKDAKVIIK
jgi:hypothetical protein